MMKLPSWLRPLYYLSLPLLLPAALCYGAAYVLWAAVALLHDLTLD